MINRFIVVYESNFRSMKYRFAPFRPRQRRPQLELNLWPKRQSLCHILERIRDDAQEALNFLGDSEEQQSLAWRCSGCGHVKHFTRPVPSEIAAPCPKCRNNSFGMLVRTYESHAVATAKATTFLLVTAGASFQYASASFFLIR